MNETTTTRAPSTPADLTETLAQELAEAYSETRTWGPDTVPDSHWYDKAREVMAKLGLA